MREPALQFLTGDVRHFDFPKEHFSYVIYAATQASAKLNQEDPMLMVDTIVQGTRHVLDFSVAAKTRKFLFLSSGAIYGRQPPELSHLDENYSGAPDILNPNSAYGMGKGMAEHLCILHAKQYQQEVKIARCFAFVGPYLPIDTHFAIGNFIRDGLLNTDIKVKSDGSPYRSYQYAADLIIWLLKILTEGESCVPYNVGSDEAISIANVAQLVAKSFNDDLVVNIEKTAQKNTLSERYVPSVRRAQTALDLKSKIELPEAILKTIAWYRLHPERIGNN
jgi:nucleoside-diphosphate-sugar epimerase